MAGMRTIQRVVETLHSVAWANYKSYSSEDVDIRRATCKAVIAALQDAGEYRHIEIYHDIVKEHTVEALITLLEAKPKSDERHNAMVVYGYLTEVEVALGIDTDADVVLDNIVIG